MMKTLILVAHPEVANSPTQQFLKASLPPTGAIQWHDITAVAGVNGHFQASAELDLVKQAQRIVFQFPFYWYSAPFILKQWQDEVFTGEVAQYGNLAGKELSVVVSLGQSLATYQAGAQEHFAISELLRPYQAFAEKLNWRYLPPLVITQFAYQTPAERQQLLVTYQQRLTLAQPASFAQRGQWLLAQLAQLQPATTAQRQQLTLIREQLEAGVAEYQTLQEQLREIRSGEQA